MLRRRRRRWCNLVNHKSWRGYESFRDQPARSVTKQNQLKIAAKLKVGDWKLKFFTLQVSQYRLFLLCYCHHLPLVRREFLQFWTKKKEKKRKRNYHFSQILKADWSYICIIFQTVEIQIPRYLTHKLFQEMRYRIARFYNRIADFAGTKRATPKEHVWPREPIRSQDWLHLAWPSQQ